MPINLPKSEAAQAATEELERWADLANLTDELLEGWTDLRPQEVAIVEVYNPAFDLQRRADKWGHAFADAELPSLLRFLAGLAMVEASSWDEERPEVAAQAIAERRFFLGDRIIHWAVPWLEAVSSWDPSRSQLSTQIQQQLLLLGDVHRPTPELVETEGMTAPGEDLFGPLKTAPPTSLLSGSVTLDAALATWDSSRNAIHQTVPAGYEEWNHRCELRWLDLRQQHEGTAALWRDLAKRAGAKEGTN